MGNAEQFIGCGLFSVEGAVPSGALRWASQVIERFIANQLAAKRSSPGVATVERGGRRFVMTITDLFDNLGAVPLYLMGLPTVEAAAQAVCGEGAVCTHAWLVVKNDGDGLVVDWHQDFVHDARFPAINVGLHLDDVAADPVRFVPGARSGAEDVAAVRARYPLDSPELMTAPVAAGGLTVHDVLLVHGSPSLSGQRWRRTLYLEFRDPRMLIDHPTLSTEYVELRRQLFQVARGLVERLGEHPEGDPFALLGNRERQVIDALRAIGRPQIEAGNYGYGG